jgi:hypothetical protein
MQFMEMDEENCDLLSTYLQNIEDEWAKMKHEYENIKK